MSEDREQSVIANLWTAYLREQAGFSVPALNGEDVLHMMAIAQIGTKVNIRFTKMRAENSGIQYTSMPPKSPELPGELDDSDMEERDQILDMLRTSPKR